MPASSAECNEGVDLSRERRTVDQLDVAAAERAIELWIETARELGREIPQPKAQRIPA
jgi:hypothetical protein